MTAPGHSSQKVQEEVQRYVKSKQLDALIGTIIEQALRYRPNYLVTFVLDFLFRKYAEEVKSAMNGAVVQELNKKLYSGRSPTDYAVKSYVATVNTDVQLELDQYLSQHGVAALCSAMVEKVLLAESPSPHALIVEFLCEQYPEQALLALELLNPPKNTAKAALAKSIADQLSEIDAQHAVLDVDSDESDNDDADDPRSQQRASITFSDDEHDADSFANELPANTASPKPVKDRLRARRQSVSSESIDPHRLQDQLANLQITAKSEEEMQHLYAMISRSAMLKRLLREEERVLLCKALQGPIVKAAGEDIIRQGEEGDVFYLLEEGRVDVFLRRVLGDEVHVHTYGAGDTFGQLALLYNTPRAATCRAVEEAKLWTLERSTFKAIVVGAALRKKETYATFLKDVPVLQTLCEKERLELTDALTEERFEDGSVVCKEGEPGDDFFLVLEGAAECFRKIAAGTSTDAQDSPTAQTASLSTSPRQQQQLVSTLQRGEYFGEVALLTNKPRQATVVAKGALKVLVVDRATFTRVLGPLEDILERNMDVYDKFARS